MRAAAAVALGALLLAAGPAAADQSHADPDVGSGFAPAVPGGMTRIRGTARPFVSALGRAGGAIVDLAIEHYFAQLPLRLSLELQPLALAVDGDGAGAIGHLRLGAAFSTEYLEIGLAAGSRLQNYGSSGISLAGFLRLGALDGLKFTTTYGYVLERNRYNGLPVIGLANLLMTFDVPLSNRTALFTEGGASADLWVYWSAGLRYRLGRPGANDLWVVSGSLGLAWVIDRPDCRHPGTGWCAGSAWALGPTMGFGLERRF